MANNQKDSVGTKKKKVTPLTAVLYSFMGVLLASVIFIGIVVVQNFNLIIYAWKNAYSISMALTKSKGEIDKLGEDNKQYQADVLGTDKETINKLDDPNLTEKEREELIYEALSGGNNSVSPENGDAVVNPDEKENTEQETPPSKDSEKKDDTVTEPSENDSVPVPVPDQTTQQPSKPDDGTASQMPVQGDKPSAEPGTDTGKTEQPVPEVPKEDTKPSDKNDGKLSEDEYNQKVAEQVAKMYSIKSDFVSKLESFEARIRQEYKALPKEQQNMSTKARIVSENMAYIEGLEASCDAQVKAVTDELTRIMTANGKDTALVQQIKQAYENEKEIKKAYYMSLYK